MNLQAVPAIVKEAQLSEPVHKKNDTGPGCADHLGQGLLTDLGDYRLRHAFFSEASQQEQYPGQSLFAGIEELID